MNTVQAQVWTGERFEGRRIQFNERVVSHQATQAPPDHFLFPAPLDLHLHGGGGADVMDGELAIRQVARAHRKLGLGGFLATTITSSDEAVESTLRHAKTVMDQPKPDEAVVLGVHLEGPFISPDRLGAQPPLDQPQDLPKLQRWLASGIVRVVTLAPEQADLDATLALADQYQVRVQLGHSACSAALAQPWFQRGCGVTHLHNAMSNAHHRETGLAGAALAYADFAEIITDGVHISESILAGAARAIPNLYAVTDATSAAGMPDGSYTLGNLKVQKKGHRVVLPDGTLAGSCLTQHQSIANLRRWGWSWPQIAMMVAIRPARWIGLDQWGHARVGDSPNWLHWNGQQLTLRCGSHTWELP